MNILVNKFRKLFRRTPLVGPSIECSPKEHWHAFSELLAGIFCSMLPIWVGTFVAFVQGSTYSWAGLGAALRGTITGGDLFIYAAAFLAPIFWILYYNPPGAGQFPSSLAHGVLTLIITVLAAVAFAMQRSGERFNPYILHSLSKVFFWLAVALVYLATLYHNHRLHANLPQEMRSDQEKFANQYKRHRQ